MRFSMFFLMGFLTACGPATFQEWRCEGEAETRKLAIELKGIDTKEELIRAIPRIKRRYNRLADLLIEARQFGEREKEPSLASEELFAELARLYEMPGGRELIESAQEEAIRKLSK